MFEQAPQGQGNIPENKDVKKKYSVAIVENSEQIGSAARDIADKKMTASQEELRGISGFFKRIWKHNLWSEVYRQKEISKALRTIKESGNLYIDEDGREQDHNAAKVAITERFVSEFETEMIHHDAGEKKDTLGNTPEEQAIKENIHNLITDYAQGNLDDATFLAEKTRIFCELRETRCDIIDKGDLYADNVLEVAKQVKQDIEHGKGLETLDIDLEVIIGKAKSGARTEAQFNAVDRITEKIQKSFVGRFINETTAASAVAIASSIGVALSQRIASSKLAAWGTFGATAVLGGGIAAARESRKLEIERKQHFREMAQGKSFDPEKTPRRTEMDKTRYETRDANTLILSLEQSLYTTSADGKQELKKDLNQSGVKAALGQLAEIESRIKISDREKIDLISYSDIKKIEQERLELDLIRAQAKVDIKKFLQTHQDIKLGQDVTPEEFLSQLQNTRILELTEGEKGIEKKNSLFKAMKKKKVAQAAIKGVLTGLVVGAVAQEAMAFISDTQHGLIEGYLNPDGRNALTRPGDTIHYTAPEFLRRYFSGELPQMGTANMHDTLIGSTHMKLPEGIDLIKDENGSYHMTREGENFVSGITVDSHGALTSEAKELLQKNNIILGESHIPGSAKDFMETLPEGAKKIHRMLWYDNDTPKPVFDKNELKLWWGGRSGTGIDTHGNFVFNVKHMMPDGSYHKDLSANAQDLMQSGKLKMLFSLSRDSQNQVFELPIDDKGNAIIDPNSEIGKMLFKSTGGHAEFLGKYAEVAQIMGEGKDHAEQVRILATHVGKGISQVEVPTDIFTIPGDYIVDQPIIPVFGRSPLEKTRTRKSYLEGYFSDDKTNKEFYYQRRSARLSENPNIRLDHYQEISDYLEKQSPEWKNKLEELSTQIQLMDKNCRVAVCIPAAGHQEGKNIFHTLEQYKNQKNKDGVSIDPRLFEVSVFVNHPKDKELDNTIKEIERFQKENPEMHVEMIYKSLDREEARIGTIRKYVTDLALLRHHKRGSIAKDLIVVSNDADCSGMSPEYISNFIENFDHNSDVDAFLGKIDWEKEAYIKSPLIHVGTRLFQYLDMTYRHHKDKTGKTLTSSGANFAFKSSIYAAVGGYEDDTLAEDRHLGIMIKSARQKARKYPIDYAGAKSYVYTNARRAVNALKRGLSPAEQWGGLDFGPDDILRETDWAIEDTVDLESEEYRKKLQIGVEKFINRTLRVYRLEPTSWEAKKALRFLGVKYRIEKRDGKDEIVITDISKLVIGLKNYQEKNTTV